MCGLLGIYNNPKIEQINLEPLLDIIEHRGPNDRGVFYDENVALGHQRLSILDLSKDGHQPMESHCKRYVLVYNGEVYNFKEIAKELEVEHSVQFNSGTDSEVILESFVHFGKKAVNKFNGMFAIAIYDRKTDSVSLFRDRLGIKPLYYSHIANELVFASELKVIKRYYQHDLKLNYKAVELFLHLGYIPAPLTIYEGVYKLEAGETLIAKGNEISKEFYWKLEDKIGEIEREESKVISVVDALLEDSIQMQLQSDVPLGVFLSGGIDSSLIAAKASVLSQQKLNTYTLNIVDKKTDEADFARKVAQYLGTDHHELTVTEKEALDLVLNLSSAYDEPFADSSIIPTYLVSKLARKEVTVALSGDGGDELFFGYGAYKWSKRLSTFPVDQLSPLITKTLALIPKYKRHARYFKNHKKTYPFSSHISSTEQNCFSIEEINNLMRSPNRDFGLLSEFETVFNSLPRELSPMEKQAFFDISYYLKDDLLTKVDRASMLNSLEVRVPILDHRIVEYSLNIDPKLKYKGKNLKYLLKQILFQHVPASYFDRPKDGFSIPLMSWLNGQLSFMIDDYLNETVVKQYEVVDYSLVKEIKVRYQAGESFLYQRVWQLILLHKFLVENF